MFSFCYRKDNSSIMQGNLEALCSSFKISSSTIRCNSYEKV